MVDSHCHLADEAFADDVAAVVARARQSGLTAVLCVLEASDEAELARGDRTAALWEAIRTTAGVHPHRAGGFAGDPGAAADRTRHRAAVDRRVRAIGEVGLDYHYQFAPPGLQQHVFAAQIDLALDLGLPLVVHTREADDDTVRVLRESGRGRVRGVFHCFSGDVSLARAALDLGFFVSFSGIVTFPKAAEVHEAARYVPADRLLVETDSPYLAPVPRRGRRNEPAWVGHVVERLALLRHQSAADLADICAANFDTLFGPDAEGRDRVVPKVSSR